MVFPSYKIILLQVSNRFWKWVQN